MGAGNFLGQKQPPTFLEAWKRQNYDDRDQGNKKRTLAAEMTCLPRPLPSEAPSMMPGKSKICISAPPYSSTPGMAVNVVKEYAATSDLVLVILDRKVDLPTDGKPTRAIRASPDFETSNPDPPLDPGPAAGSSS